MVHSILPIARKAGEILLSHYKTDLQIESKDDDSPVTIADKQASAAIVEALQKLDPQTPIISEELPVPDYELRRHWKSFWIIDPLDGTKEFLRHSDDFTVNIARVDDGVPAVGVLYAPVHGAMYFAEKGKGAWKQLGDATPQRIYSSPGTPPYRIVHSRSHDEAEVRQFIGDIAFREMLPQGSALKFGTLAEGRVDLYARLHPCVEWDVAAGDCIFLESGKAGPRKSGLTYNKPDLSVEPFLLGFD